MIHVLAYSSIWFWMTAFSEQPFRDLPRAEMLYAWKQINRWTREGFVLDIEVEGIEGEALDNLKPVTTRIDIRSHTWCIQCVGFFLSKVLLTKWKVKTESCWVSDPRGSRAQTVTSIIFEQNKWRHHRINKTQLRAEEVKPSLTTVYWLASTYPVTPKNGQQPIYRRGVYEGRSCWNKIQLHTLMMKLLR